MGARLPFTPACRRLARWWITVLDRLANGQQRATATDDFTGPTLRGKVMLVVLSTTGLALLLSAAALLFYEQRAYRHSREADLQTQADIVGQAMAAALSFKDTRAAAENLHMLRLRPQITTAAVYLSKGELFATYLRPPQQATDIPLTTGDPGFAVRGDRLELFHPIRQNDELLGWLYLRTDNDLAGRLSDYVIILLGVMAASTAAAALLTARLQRAVTEPILRVAQVARDVMVQRDFSLRAPRTSSDEVGQLVDAFNDMLAEVAARTQALEQSNHHLSVEMAERRKAEEALRTAARKKDEFLATLAHELRNPLAPISNAAEILRRTGDQDAALRQRALDIMGRQLRQMVRLIDDLLDVSRITTGKLLLHRERVDLLRVLNDAVEIAQPMLEARRHAFEQALPPGPIYIEADATRLAQVFANLLNNAAKYTPDGGQIRLALDMDAEEVTVTVEDNGIGIPPDMQRAVFDMFVQGGPPIEHGRAGLGVGLTLARQLTALHGGRIAVHSAGPQQGSAFSVTLPRCPDPARAAPDVPARPIEAAMAQGAGRLHVLVADDNVDFATSLAQILEGMGHQTTVVHDGEQALGIALAQAPDVVILDIGMPGLNGHEVAHELRQHPQTRDTLLIAITGWNQDSDRDRSRASGITHHLAKPVEVAQLLEILEPLVESTGNRECRPA
jgi:signal transduction histidine kinase/ActR/RegA family two-component response regulator